jgi:hypothetical protein
VVAGFLVIFGGMVILRHRPRTQFRDALQSGDVFLPLLLDDGTGTARANDWANGFVRGMEMRRESWSVLMDDDEHGGSLIPILALAHEHHPDPEMRPYKGPMSTGMRERLIAGAAAGVMAIFRYFESNRLLEVRARANADVPAGGAQGWTQRPVPLWIRQKIQALLRQDEVSLRSSNSRAKGDTVTTARNFVPPAPCLATKRFTFLPSPSPGRTVVKHNARANAAVSGTLPRLDSENEFPAAARSDQTGTRAEAARPLALSFGLIITPLSPSYLVTFIATIATQVGQGCCCTGFEVGIAAPNR